MGLFDKIKKAIDDSGVVDAAKAAVKSFTESTEESQAVETPQKQIVEEKNAEKEVKEAKPKAPPKPACEHGECVVCPCTTGKELFYTCEASVKCDKKTKYKAGDLWDKDLLPVIKAYASYENSRSYDAQSTAERKVANTILKTYVPDLKTWEFTSFVQKTTFIGIKKNNPLLLYFVTLCRRNFVFDKTKIEKYQTVAKIVWDKSNYRINLEAAEWLYNPSLYENEQLEFVTEALLTFSDEKWLQEHLLDTSVVDFNQFYNEDGSIKQGGYAGLDGDTIYNVLKNWCKGNKNEEKFAEERRAREEEEREAREKAKIMQMCNSCRKKYKCLGVGTTASCPHFEPYGL